jgi:hypothetical protein
LPLAIQSWTLTSLQQRLFKTGGRLIRHAGASSCDSPKARRKLLDAGSRSADPRAHRATCGVPGRTRRVTPGARGMSVERGTRRRCC